MYAIRSYYDDLIAELEEATMNNDDDAFDEIVLRIAEEVA